MSKYVEPNFFYICKKILMQFTEHIYIFLSRFKMFNSNKVLEKSCYEMIDRHDEKRVPFFSHLATEP